MSINRAILLGFVGRDPDIRTGQNGDKVATFSLATSESWKDKTTGERKEATEWHTIVVFNPSLIPVIEGYVKKGSRLAVEGAIKTRKWQDKAGADRYSTEIVIGRFDGRLSLEGQGGGGTPAREEGAYGTHKVKDAPSNSASPRPEIDDDIPF